MHPNSIIKWCPSASSGLNDKLVDPPPLLPEVLTGSPFVDMVELAEGRGCVDVHPSNCGDWELTLPKQVEVSELSDEPLLVFVVVQKHQLETVHC